MQNNDWLIGADNAMRVAVDIELETQERQLLERLSVSRSTSVRLAERSRIVLLAAQGKTNGKIAEALGISRQRQGAGAIVTISLVWMVSRKTHLGRDARRRFRFGR